MKIFFYFVLGRCLGAARKLKFIMPFLIFKLGVIVTTLGFLTLFSVKGLGILLLLLLINTGGIVSKFAILKSQLLSNSHETAPKEIYLPRPAPSPQVHLHVHKDPDGHYNLLSSSASHQTSGYGSTGPAPTGWADRINQGISETRTPTERLELLNMYKRLGFNVDSLLAAEASRRIGNAKGVTFIYPGEVKAPSASATKRRRRK